MPKGSKKPYKRKSPLGTKKNKVGNIGSIGGETNRYKKKKPLSPEGGKSTVKNSSFKIELKTDYHDNKGSKDQGFSDSQSKPIKGQKVNTTPKNPSGSFPSKNKKTQRAADTKNITKIGKY